MADHDHSDDFAFGGSDSPGFENGGGSASGLQIATPRLVWLLLGGLAGVLGLTLAAALGQRILPASVGWVLGGPVAIGLLAVFVHTESRRHAMPTSVDYGWVRPCYAAAVALALVAVVVSAVRIALWAGRL